MIVDYHMHLRAPDESLDHTLEGVERFVEAAAAGTGRDRLHRARLLLRADPLALDAAVPAEALQARHRAVCRRRDRVEAPRHGGQARDRVDFVPGREEETAALLAPYPWDYVLGSIHFIGDAGIDGEPTLIDEVGVEEAWRRY